MFSKTDVKDYLEIKREIRANGYALLAVMGSCFICAALGKEILGVSPGSLAIIGVLVGLQAVCYFTSKLGAGRACELLDKSIHSDPDAVRYLAELKEERKQ